MLKTSGHIRDHYVQCAILYEEFKNKNGNGATIRNFMNKIDAFGNEIEDENKRNVFKGDMLEILAEIFFKAFVNDPRIGLLSYEPVKLEDDYGTDGIGINAAGEKCAVQVKYRSNALDKVTYTEISKTHTSAMLQHGIPLVLGRDNGVYVFTTAFEVSHQCTKVFGKMLRVISQDVISVEIDNNVSFWNFAFNEIKETLLN
jgi:hypothetical protein